MERGGRSGDKDWKEGHAGLHLQCHNNTLGQRTTDSTKQGNKGAIWSLLFLFLFFWLKHCINGREEWKRRNHRKTQNKIMGKSAVHSLLLFLKIVMTFSINKPRDSIQICRSERLGLKKSMVFFSFSFPFEEDSLCFLKRKVSVAHLILESLTLSSSFSSTLFLKLELFANLWFFFLISSPT